MGRRKKFTTPTEWIGGRIRKDHYDDLMEMLGRVPIVEFLEEAVESKVEEYRRRKELRALINGTLTREDFNSPLASVFHNIKEKHHHGDNDKPQSDILEQMYLTPFDEIVKNNTDDPEYMRDVMLMLKKRYEWIKALVVTAEASKSKFSELDEAMRKNREWQAERERQEKEREEKVKEQEQEPPQPVDSQT